jgi:hypothetical protein
MAKTITQLPDATTVGASDEFIIQQGGITKRATKLEVLAGVGINLNTAQATTSGTSIDFTGIPSWVKRITVMLNGVSTNGSSSKLVQLGTSGGIVTSAYDATGGGFNYSSATSGAASTAGFPINSGGAGDVLFGIVTICNVSSNSWVCSGTVKVVDSYIAFVAGGVALSGALDRIRLTTVNGTDTFDAGSVNIMYEG